MAKSNMMENGPSVVIARSWVDVPALCCDSLYSESGAFGLSPFSNVSLTDSRVTVATDDTSSNNRIVYGYNCPGCAPFPSLVFNNNSFEGYDPGASTQTLFGTFDYGIDATSNYWGPVVTAEMDAKGGSANITAFWNFYDDITLQTVSYSVSLTPRGILEFANLPALYRHPQSSPDAEHKRSSYE